jgi:hypothetical protein
MLHERSQERVEVAEMMVEHALGTPSLSRNGPAGQRARTVTEQDFLGGLKKLLASVG